MRPTASVVVATLLVLNVALLAGQAAAPQTDLSKLTPKSEGANLQFQNAKFADVTKFLGLAFGIEIRLAPDVNVTDPISLRFTQAGFADVFRFLVTEAKVDYTVVDDKTVLITNKP